jgi:hypothetical protein
LATMLPAIAAANSSHRTTLATPTATLLRGG